MPEPTVLHEMKFYTSGNNFVMLKLIVEDIDQLRQYIHDLKLLPEDEYYFHADYGVADEIPTEADLEDDRLNLNYWINNEAAPWEAVFMKLARKKNGTFHKNRVFPIHRIAVSEHGYSEESYGFYGDELKIRNVNDTTAVLVIENCIRKYDEGRYSLSVASLTS